MRKKIIILLCIVIGVSGSIIAVYLCKNRKSEPVSSTVSSSIDLTEQKDEALQEIQSAYDRLSEDAQGECENYIEQAKENIENATTERAIQAALHQTLEYLDNVGKEQEETAETVSKSDTVKNDLENEELYPLGKEKDGRSYVPICNPANWPYLSEEKQKKVTEKSIPVLKDENNTIDVICQDILSSTQTYSYTLPQELGLWCEDQGIEAHQGEYLAYGTYQDNHESFYLVLDDEEETVVLATYYKRTISWMFEKTDMTRAEVIQDTEEGDAGIPE